jgi:hypothetical protein
MARRCRERAPSTTSTEDISRTQGNKKVEGIAALNMAPALQVS